MSRDKMEKLSLAELMAIAAGAIKKFLPDGKEKPEPIYQDWASI